MRAEQEHGSALNIIECLGRRWARGNHAVGRSGQPDITDLDWLKLEPNSVGLDGDELMNPALADEYKNRLNQNLAHAVKQNLFGLPAVGTGGKLFFGNDRLDLLRHFLSAYPPYLGIQSDPCISGGTSLTAQTSPHPSTAQRYKPHCFGGLHFVVHGTIVAFLVMRQLAVHGSARLPFFHNIIHLWNVSIRGRVRCNINGWEGTSELESGSGWTGVNPLP